jgi:hypothetical protein
VTPATSAVALDAAAERAILTVPEGCETPVAPWSEYPKLGYQRSPDLDPGVAGGARFDHVNEPRFALRQRYPRLIVGPAGVAYVEPTDAGYLLPYEAIAAFVVEGDDSASIVDERGFMFSVSPTIFKDARRAISLLEAALPSSKVVRQVS